VRTGRTKVRRGSQARHEARLQTPLLLCH
jgi:hypothetical protein